MADNDSNIAAAKDDAIKTKGYFIYPIQLFVNVAANASTQSWELQPSLGLAARHWASVSIVKLSCSSSGLHRIHLHRSDARSIYTPVFTCAALSSVVSCNELK